MREACDEASLTNRIFSTDRTCLLTCGSWTMIPSPFLSDPKSAIFSETIGICSLECASLFVSFSSARLHSGREVYATKKKEKRDATFYF